MAAQHIKQTANTFIEFKWHSKKIDNFCTVEYHGGRKERAFYDDSAKWDCKLQCNKPCPFKVSTLPPRDLDACCQTSSHLTPRISYKCFIIPYNSLQNIKSDSGTCDNFSELHSLKGQQQQKTTPATVLNAHTPYVIEFYICFVLKSNLANSLWCQSIQNIICCILHSV